MGLKDRPYVKLGWKFFVFGAVIVLLPGNRHRLYIQRKRAVRLDESKEITGQVCDVSVCERRAQGFTIG